MKELLGTDEALQAALMITGQNAVGAASDLEQMKMQQVPQKLLL